MQYTVPTSPKIVFVSKTQGEKHNASPCLTHQCQAFRCGASMLTCKHYAQHVNAATTESAIHG